MQGDQCYQLSQSVKLLVLESNVSITTRDHYITIGDISILLLVCSTVSLTQSHKIPPKRLI